MIAHIMMPDGQTVFDFGDIWQGPLTRAKQGEDYAREYPTGTLKSNFNLLYRVAARFKDPQAQAVAARCAGFGHTNQEEWWTLFWRDPSVAAAPMSEIPRAHTSRTRASPSTGRPGTPARRRSRSRPGRRKGIA